MLVTEEIRETLSSLTASGCNYRQCQDDVSNLRDSLTTALESERVTDFKQDGRWLLNGIHPRRVYTIVQDGGHRLKIAFTGMSSIMVFSSRGRYTHCRPDEFQERLQKFLSR